MNYMLGKIIVLWDIDGVVLDTPHEEAWRTIALRWGAKEFTEEFYLKYVAGKPREEGAYNIMERLGLFKLHKCDVPEKRKQLLKNFCDEKDETFKQLILKGTYKVYEDALNAIIKLKENGLKNIAISASRNVLNILRRTPIRLKHYKTLYDIFDDHICGIGDKDKIFEEALRRYRGLFYIVVEDSPHGIAKAKEFNFMTIGICRKGHASPLENAGADIVIRGELKYDDLRRLISRRLRKCL